MRCLKLQLYLVPNHKRAFCVVQRRAFILTMMELSTATQVLSDIHSKFVAVVWLK